MPKAAMKTTVKKKPKTKSKSSNKSPAVKLVRTQSLGKEEGLYTQIKIGKRKIWVSKRGAQKIMEFKKADKTEKEIFDLARKYSLKATAKKKNTFRQNMQNALETSDASDEQIEKLKAAIDQMDDNEISQWAAENSDLIEEVLDYKEELKPGSNMDIANSRRERSEAIDKLIEGLRAKHKIA